MTFEEWWYKKGYNYGQEHNRANMEFAWNAATAAERKQAEIDAVRYRKLRDANMDIRNRLEHYAGSELDVAIDKMEES